MRAPSIRWVAQVASQLVFADPANRDARELAADALEQLGYQAESATARNAYLQGAFELRNGVPNLPGGSGAAPDIIRSLPLDMYFDFMAVRLNGDKAAGKTIVLNWRFTDTKQDYVLNLENSALTCVPDMQADNADATLTLTRATLDEISLQKTTFQVGVAVRADRGHRQGRESSSSCWRCSTRSRSVPGRRAAPDALTFAPMSSRGAAFDGLAIGVALG